MSSINPKFYKGLFPASSATPVDIPIQVRYIAWLEKRYIIIHREVSYQLTHFIYTFQN